MTAEHSMRCVAQTGWGARCRRFGDIRVTATGGRVCRQHHRFGWIPHRLPDDVEVDPRIAARAAAVLGADHARPRVRASEPEEEEVEREPGPAAEAFADLGRDLGARLAADRALLRRRLNHGAAAVFTATNCNRKLSPVELVDVGRRFKQPRVRAPYCSTKFASIQGSCPDTCRFKMKQGRSNGCFADAGFTAMRSRRYDRAAVGLSPLEVIAQEAREIRQAFGGGRIPQDGMEGGRDLRLHVGGDAPTAACAQLLGGAAADWRRRGGGAVWTYTHAFRDVPRAAWGPAVSVLASILILSLDPEGGAPDLDDPRKGPRFLTPPDLVHQVGGLTDNQASELVRLMVRACVGGAMSPDSDFRELWKKVITRTVQYFTLGGHPKDSA
jgi:hypothetical protein